VRVSSWSAIPWQFKTPSGIRTVQVDPAFLVNNAGFATQLVFAGAGISQMMEFQVMQGLREGRLVHVLPRYPCPDIRPMVAAYPHERNRLPRVKAMLDFLEDTFAPRPWRRDATLSPPGSSPARRR
jgi:DNA-binding transcriptional LysR family regulator